MAAQPPPQHYYPQRWIQDPAWQQHAIPDSAISPAPDQINSGNFSLSDEEITPSPEAKKKARLRLVAIALALALAVTLYFIWHTSSSTVPSPVTTQQNFGSASTLTSSNGSTSITTSGEIQVY